MDHLLILDTETASLERGVVDLAFVEIDDHLRILQEVQSFINPEVPIDPRAAGIHGITDDMVADKPTLSSFMASIGNPFDGKKVLMIGHNIAFDIKHVNPHFGVIEPLCTLKLARIAFPDAPDHKLQTLMYYRKLTPKGKHNALDDVYTCYELLQDIANVLDTDLEGLYHLAKKPLLVEKMPFGKHKGMPLKDVPRAYVAWLLGQENVDENLRWSFEQLGYR